ncbi:unnamed protein product [Sphagnum tenellum]
MEMSVRRRKAEQIVSGLEQQINLHLLKLLGFQADKFTRQHWKRELETWLLRIAGMTLKPDDKPIPANVVYEWLYDEMFGGSEIRNVAMMLCFLGRDYQRNDVDVTTISNRLQSIHLQLAECIAKNDPGQEIIGQL